MDPTIIAVVGTFFGAGILKYIEYLLSKNLVKHEKVEAKSPVLGKVVGRKTVFDCVVYDQRLFEKQLVEAKVILNVETFCEDKECPECRPNRPGNGRPAPAIDTVNTQRWRMQETWTKERVEAAKREKKRAAEAFAKSRAGQQRMAVVSGRVVPIPNNVPKFATGVLVYDPLMLRDDIVWQWTVDGDPHGRPVVLRQHIDPVVFRSFPLAARPEVGVIADNGIPLPPKGKGGGSPAKTLTAGLKREYEKIMLDLVKVQEENQKLNETLMKLHSEFDRKGTPSTGPR